MSTEYEANSNDIMQKSLSNDDDTLEDLAGSANNSLLGKVKSRVSSIIPSSLSKWFSPTTRNNDSLNGSFNVGSARRRRRIEIDDEEYIDDANESIEEGILAHNEHKGHFPGRSGNIKDTDEDDTDNNSDEDVTNETGIPSQRAHYTMKTYGSVRQPPSKRSRISFDTTNIHQPLVASTPAIGNSQRYIPTNTSTLEDKLSKPTMSHTLKHHMETTAYNQRELDQRTSYGFFPTAATKDVKIQENIASKLNSSEKLLDSISSRRTLHLPSTSQLHKERSMGLSSLKRQSLSGVTDIKKHNAETLVTNNSTIIEAEDEAQISQNYQSDVKASRNLNGSSLSIVGTKKQKLNGTDEADETNPDVDSASECSEGCVGNISELPNNVSLKQHNKTGLFNMSSLSFLNEGRKSLFSGGMRAGDPSNALNNSTLSLTSLNRRQFNASIYGSTSALSDSRLLNTFSPFYKGKTTYGGAAAYKKYSSGDGASRVCNITPTVIRPTSSLSTLSSSNNSLAATTGANNPLSGAENNSAISSTAKRILDLINDFATPISEAKKMANTNVKANPLTIPRAKSRLNESDLQTSRAIRLSQVRTPYTRPAVTLQPITRNAEFPPPIRELQVPSMSQLLQMKKMQSTTERSRQIAMQNSTSTMRTVVGSGEHQLPILTETRVDDNTEPVSAHQQQHTNKIKSKIRTSARITASKNVTNTELDELTPTVNLPNIAFPQMQSVPTFDIDICKTQNVVPTAIIKNDLSKLDNISKLTDGSKVSSAISNTKTNIHNMLTSKTKTTFDIGSSNIKSGIVDPVVTDTNLNFKFSYPLVIPGIAADVSSPKMAVAAVASYIFSPPATVYCGEFENTPSPPQLKSGSVLDALKNPINLPSEPKKIAKAAEDTEVKIGFGDQFKKSAANKWECETCLIHNECTSQKCVACETPRKTVASINQTAPQLSLPAFLNAGSSTFGGQFKRPSDQWECEVCMIRNKDLDVKCVACETPRKGAAVSTQFSGKPSNSWKANTFGDTFKPKPNTWECPTCLINNKSDSNECIACQTKNPIGSSRAMNSNVSDDKVENKATTFKLGSASADTGFKSLAAAQMSAKWECDACMTRNDAARNKCVCCEQAKPGTTTPDVPSNGPKFTFGTTASTKFTFGFVTHANEESLTESSEAVTSAAISNQKTDGVATKGFVFGSKPNTSTSLPGTGFSFGIHPVSATTKNVTSNKSIEGKDITDKGSCSPATISEKNTSGLRFGAGYTSTKEDLTTTSTSFKFGIPSSTGTSNTTTASSPVVKFNLTVPVTSSGSVKSDTTETPRIKTTTGEFTIGSSSIANTTSPPTAGFSFGVPVQKVDGQKSSTTTDSVKKTTSTSFTLSTTVFTPSTQTATTSATATVKPMFSFGSNTPTASTTSSTSTGKSATIASSNTANFSNPKGEFSFGNSISGKGTASPTTKSIFGSFVTPSTTISADNSVGTSVPTSTMPKPPAAPTNVFGTFGENASLVKATITSKASTPPLASTLLPTTSTITFGGTPSASVDSKPTASATMIFGSASNAATGNKATGSDQSTFVFGSSTSNATTTPASNTYPSGTGISSSGATWPKGGFSFGASVGNSSTTNTNESSKPVFGSFIASATPAAAASMAIPGISAGNSVFGSTNVSNTNTGTTATFGSVAANASTVGPAPIFGTGASTAPMQATPNLFGNAATKTSIFGASPSFGSGNCNMSNNTSTFGGVASSATFGSFGSTTSSRANSGDGASAAKKSEPAFNFGSNTSQIASSGGFNFGAQASATAKPAFNFSASNAPTFNFTGSSGDAAKPFQFGATASAPVFNFSGGAVETDSSSSKCNGWCHAGSTQNPSNDKTSYTTVEQLKKANASKGVELQKHKQLTGQLRGSRQMNNKHDDNNTSNSKVTANAQNDDESKASKTIQYVYDGEKAATATKIMNSSKRQNIIRITRTSGSQTLTMLNKNVGMVMVGNGNKNKYGYNDDVNNANKPKIALNKYKYVRKPDNLKQNSCNDVTAKNFLSIDCSKIITTGKLNLCKNKMPGHHHMSDDEIRCVKRSILVQKKFNRNAGEECVVVPTTSVELAPRFTSNQFRKVNLNNIVSIARSKVIENRNEKISKAIGDGTLLTSTTTSSPASAILNKYRLVRCRQENSKLNTVQSQSVESLTKDKKDQTEDERMNIARKVCNSFVITKSNRAQIASDVTSDNS
ncbi:nuclear pore complex protein Nup153 isoform X2 [Eurosta solidaginis]|uniref:nuclear pore complex protein Nup153 isoform X2 n=1 Tax=Eurosta solidaginis TaxID=178769 RepID=UPI0035305AB9